MAHRRGWLLPLAIAATGCSPAARTTPLAEPALEAQASGTTALLQAVSAPSDSVVWASGHRGTWVRTTDGGRTWRAARVPGADTLQFRDVFALDANRAWLMSAGPGALSRIYRTTDGGSTWELQFTNTEPTAFYDCIDFWDERRGLAFSDQVGGRVMVLATSNGGAEWALVPQESLPAALPDEGGFAASGTCLVTRPGGHAWIATGNALTVAGDLSSRTVLCTLDPGCERPEDREFDVNLHIDVPQRRGELATAALTIVRAFLAAGAPHQGVPVFGRFEQWSRFAREPLAWLGHVDPCETRRSIESRDPVRDQIGKAMPAFKGKVYHLILEEGPAIRGGR